MKALCLLNHELTENQLAELKQFWNCDKIILPPQELKTIWSQLSADYILSEQLESFIKWIKENSGTGSIIIIQGEFGATFALVDWSLKNGLIPIHSVTKRVAKETKNGEEIHREYIFKHIKFRKYERI